MKTMADKSADLEDFLRALEKVCNASGESPMDPIDDMKAFGVFWAIEEFKALGALDQIQWDEELAEEFHHRMFEFGLARCEYHCYLRKKECPQMDDPDKDVGQAALAGLLLSQRRVDEPIVVDFLSRLKTVSGRAHKMFTKWTHEPLKIRWQHQALDTWLICIWPIVTLWEWTYKDVIEVAKVKFPEGSGYPFEEETDMSKHCRVTLKLKVDTQPGQKKTLLHVKHPMPKLHEVALKIGL